MSVSISKSKQLKQKISFSGIVLLLGVAILIGFNIGTNEPQTDKSASGTLPAETINRNSLPKAETIETAWKWNASPDTKYAVQQTAVTNELDALVNQSTQNLFTQESVYNALKSVKLDDNSEVIIDNDALRALNQTFENLGVILDSESLIELQDIIINGLPDPAGEQVAQIVADFYSYFNAQKEFEALYQVDNDFENNTFEQQVEQYNELLALRELYLGEDVSSKLFSTSNANARYIFDSLELDNNKLLTKEEKMKQQSEITKRHAEETITINNWSGRYSKFLMDKQSVLDSSLNDEEKRMQLRQLMDQHFNKDELKQVGNLQLDSF